MTEHDKLIIEAAERYADEFGCLVGPALSPKAHAIVAAVAAKREAERPKLLTAEEAYEVWSAAWMAGSFQTAAVALRDAAHERARKVIEHALCAAHPGDGDLPRFAETIRTALQVKP